MLELQFYLLTTILITTLTLILDNAGIKARTFLIGITAWIAYIFVLSLSGVLRDFSLPPRMPLLLVIPAFGIISWIFLTGLHRPLLGAVPRWLPMVFQSFRIWVEFLLLGVHLKGLASAEPTMAGYNFDILVPISGLMLAFLVYKQKVLSEKWVLVWNIMGLCILASVVFVFITLGAFPAIWGYEVTTVSPKFGGMPYPLVAGFFMPVAVMVHVFSIGQVRKALKGVAA